MSIDPYQKELLEQAVRQIRAKDVAPYFELKKSLGNLIEQDRLDFRKKFATYYGLNQAHLGESLEDRYFQILFGYDDSGNNDPYTPILRELYPIKRRKGDQILCFSFVSKLVSLHDESRPIFDKYVQGFFGVSPPTVGSIDFRIAGFVRNLGVIRRAYESWSADATFQSLTASLLEQIPECGNCHPHRICDFLVWTVGRFELGKEPRNLDA